MTDVNLLLNAFLGLFALLIAVLGIMLAEYRSAKSGGQGGPILHAYQIVGASLVLVLFTSASFSFGLIAYGDPAIGISADALIAILFFLSIVMAYAIWKFMR